MRISITIVTFLASGLLHSQSLIKKTYFDEENTQLKEVISLNPKDSTLEGPYQSFFLNGSLASSGFYHKSMPDSVWVFHFENGFEKASGKYRLGRQIGLWKYYFENGNKKAIGTLNGEVKHGFWTFYYENGKEKSSGIYYSNKKEGIWNYLYEDGTLKAQAFYSQGVGTYKEFYPSGILQMQGTNADDRSEGFWTYYYESGEKEAEGDFINGLREGRWVFYHQNGQIAAEGLYLKGEKQGVWKYYFPDGATKSEGEMIDDQKDGHWKLYYQSGLLKGEGKYDVGTGDYVEYYENGKQKARGNFIEGKKEGKWVYFTENGQVDGTAEFVNGEGEYRGVYEDGTLKMTGRLNDDRRVGDWTLYNPDGSVAGVYRPLYEDEKPIFRTAESIEKDLTQKSLSDKPEYKFKNNTIRYFEHRINEYTGIIVGTNPLWTLTGKLPVAIEYYIQERMGYELQFTLYNDPFFSKINLNQIGTHGVLVELRQKFYQYDSPTGMIYFGHELMGGYFSHSTISLDSSDFVGLPPERVTFDATSSRIGYGFFVGNRWMQRTSDSGFTIDVILGFSIARQYFDAKYEPNESQVGLFRDYERETVIFPLTIGINIGYAGPKRRTTSF